MTHGNYPGQQPNTPGFGESNQGYGPGAGQPAGGYGAPAAGGYGYGAPADPYGSPTAPRQTYGVVGAIITVLGVIGCVVAFTATNWYRGRGDSHFGDVHDLVSQLDKVNAASGLAVLYFGWLAWVLLAVGAVVALAANAPSPASSALRLIGALVGVAGIVVTLLSVKLISKSAVASSIGAPSGLGGYLKDAAHEPSLYLAAGGFLLIAIGALVGPQRR